MPDATLSPEDQTAEMMARWGALLREMRRDCGHYHTKLSISEMLGSFVNDIGLYRDQIDKRSRRPLPTAERARSRAAKTASQG